MNKILYTQDYDMFKFRTDNRCATKRSHVDRLKKSIEARNLLFMNPIHVNQGMEVINGQHRLFAAQELGVPIYYTVIADFKPEDMLAMNTTLSWKMIDIFNFYCKNGYIEYQKLDKYIKSSGIPRSLAVGMCTGRHDKMHEEFKSGKYVFDESRFDNVDLCNRTLDIIKNAKGISKSQFTESKKFWTCLLQLFRHPDFIAEKWLANLKVHIDKISLKADHNGYINLFLSVYNWRSHNKISFTEDIKIDE